MFTALITNMTEVFTAIMSWIVSAIQSAIPIFWTASADGGSLTFIGTLCIISLSIGLVFLVIGIIQNFVHLRS